MSFYSPIRDFFQRRQATSLDKRAAGVELITLRSECVRGNFVFPGRDIEAAVDFSGQTVGWISYGISPLKDRVYINDFHISPAHQRHGLGIAALWRLWQFHRVSLTPLHEVGSSVGFWEKARRRFAGAGVELTKDVRTGDQSREQERWLHMIPEPEHERLIRELMESADWPTIKARMDAEHKLLKEIFNRC